MDRLIGPCATEAQLPPVAYVLCARAGHALIPGQRFPAPAALGAKNAVELLQRELGKRIVLVHEDRVRRGLVGYGEASGGDLDLDRIHPRALVRSITLEWINRTAHQRD